MKRMPKFTRTRPDEGGFTMVELMVVIAIVSVLALIATPLLLGSREKAWVATCDDLYYSLSSELQNELDTLRNKGASDAGKKALDLIVPRHEFLDVNPRNKMETAFIDQDACGPFVPPQARSCQVFYCFDGENTIAVQQFSVSGRSYRITVE